MSLLERLKQETERLKNKGAKKVYVSSGTVQAFRVAHEKKELLSNNYPLILSVDDTAPITSLSLLDASVGPDLHWTLSSINHVLRTVSKYNEPTYIFANILDNDPQAFVAVTLRKSTPDDELEHLESVIGKVSQLHIAEKKPMQVPDPGDVVKAVGKGLMAVLGISDGSKQKEMRERERERERERQQQREREQQERREAAERAAYMSSRAGAGDSEGVRVAVHGKPAPGDDKSYAPSAPVMYGRSDYHSPDTLRTEGQAGWGARAGGHAQPMGVSDKKAADARLAALKAELSKEGQPPAAPDLKARPEDATPSNIYTPPADTSTAYRRQQPQQDWQRHAPGTLSNPYTSHDEAPSEQYSYTGRDSTTQGAYDYSPAGAAATDYSHYPSIPTDKRQDTDLSYDPTRATDRGRYSYSDTPGGGDFTFEAPKPSSGQAGSRMTEREMLELQREAQQRAKGYGTTGRYDYDRQDVDVKYDTRPYSYGDSGERLSDVDRQLRDEAYQARLEWEKTQREAQERAEQQRRAADAGWGTSKEQGKQQQQHKKEKKPAPDWLDVLGKVFGGGPAYSPAYAANAPDL